MAPQQRSVIVTVSLGRPQSSFICDNIFTCMQMQNVLVEPWSSNGSRSSNDKTLHHLSRSSTAMYSPTKRCLDNDHSCATMSFPEAHSESGTVRDNRIQTFQDKIYSCDEYHKSNDPRCSLGQEKGYYYGTHKSEQKLYNYQESKYSHSNNIVRRDPLLNHSYLGTTHYIPGAMENESSSIPGAIESESSSLDSLFDYSDSMVSNDSKYKSFREAEIMSRHHTGYWKEDTDDYEPLSASKYGFKTSAYLGPQIGATASYAPSYPKDVPTSHRSTTKCNMIEVAPGEYMRLRGAHETWKAIQNDFYLPCACVCCDLTLFCIQDATYVLCPQCQVVNPLETIDGYDGGVGLGFTMEELAEWQNDILTMDRQF